MKAFEPVGDVLHLYAAPEVWPMLDGLVRGFRGSSDVHGTLVGLVSGFSHDQLPPSLEAERLLDRHWIVYDQRDADTRRRAERSFFDAIADHYESEIDAARNRAN